MLNSVQKCSSAVSNNFEIFEWHHHDAYVLVAIDVPLPDLLALEIDDNHVHQFPSLREESISIPWHWSFQTLDCFTPKTKTKHDKFGKVFEKIVEDLEDKFFSPPT